MICKIKYFSEMEFGENDRLQLQDELIEGETVYVTQKHQMTIEAVVINDKNITILDGEKILKLTVIS